MGRWTLEDSGNHDLVRLPNGQWFYADEIEVDIHGLHNADCDRYEARIAELEALLRDEVADNVRLRSRYTGDAEANLEQEICDLNNKVTELEDERDAARQYAHTMDLQNADYGRLVDRNNRLWKCIDVAIRLKNKYHQDLAAATATLERLREVVPEGDGRSWSMLDAVYHILYPPTPETPHEMD